MSAPPAAPPASDGLRAFIDRQLAIWTPFFFTPERNAAAAYYRVALAVWTAFFFLARVPYLRDIWVDPPYSSSSIRWNLIGGPPALTEPLVIGLLVTLGVALLAFACNLGARVAHVVVLVILCVLMGTSMNSIRAYGKIAFLQWVFFWFAAYTRPKDALTSPAGVRLVQLGFCAIYIFTVVAKLVDGGGWLTGLTPYSVYNGEAFGSYLISSVIPMPMPVAVVFGWATIAAEFFIAFGLFTPRWRLWATLACLALHGGLMLTTRITPMFGTLMWIHLPLFWLSNAVVGDDPAATASPDRSSQSR